MSNPGGRDQYLANVWRLLFTCTRGEKGWSAISDPAFYDRIYEWGLGLGRDLDLDLDLADASINAGLNREQWLQEVENCEPASS